MISAAIISLGEAYSFIILIYVIMSWIPNMGGFVLDLYRAMGRICDPYLDLFRRFIPPVGGMVDVSPILALLVLQFGVRFIAFLL